MDIRNLPSLCGDHIRRLGEIYRSHLPEPDKERAFASGLRESAECVSCMERRDGTFMPRRMKVKICVVGDKSTEKAAILSPFVRPMFDEGYIQTLGTQVSRKELIVASPSGLGEIVVDIMVWNITGQKGFRQLLKEVYFSGAKGALCVSDGTLTDG